MGFIKDEDVQTLMANDALMTEVAKELITDPKTMQSMADDIADKLEDELDNNPNLRKKIVEAAMTSEEFKKLVVSRLAAEIN